MSRAWASHTKKVVDEIERKFDLPVPCTTYKNHGVMPSGRDGEPFGIDVWVAPYGQRANQSQEALGDSIQKWLEANWDRLGIHYVIWWGWMTYRPGQWFKYDPGTYHNPIASPDPDTVMHMDHLHIQVAEEARYSPPKDDDPGIVWGVDIHPQFQSGISPEQIAKEDFSFLIAKASQGTWQQLYGSREYVKAAQDVGMVAGYYHFLDSDNVWRQLEAFLEVVGNPDGKIICVDFEDPKDYGIKMRGAPSITDLYNFVYALREKLKPDHPIWIYSANWYFQLIGNPDITALMKDKNCIPWASRYVNGAGYASRIYQNVPARWWDGEDSGGFGGQKPKVLQFTDRASVAGYEIDANAFRGTRAQLEALAGVSSPGEPIKPLVPPGPEPEALGQVIIGNERKPLRIKEGNAIAHNQRKQGRAARFVPFTEAKEIDVGRPTEIDMTKVPGFNPEPQNQSQESHGPSNKGPQEQETEYRPTRKVTAAGVGYFASLVIVYVLTQFAGVEVPVEVREALTALLTLGSAWIVKEGA